VRREKASDHGMAQRFRISVILFIGIWVSFAFLACKKETPPPKSSPPISPAPRVAAAPSPTTASPLPSAAVAQPSEKTPSTPPSVYTYDPKGRPDPFVPLVLPQEREEGKKSLKGLAVSELKLSGIVWDKKEYVALVEAPDGLGYVLKVNDLIGSSARVVRIAPNSVTFEVKEKPFLPDSKIKEVELKLKKEE